METEGAHGVTTIFTSIEMVHKHASQQRGFLWKMQQGRGNVAVVQILKMPIAATGPSCGLYRWSSSRSEIEGNCRSESLVCC